MNTKSLAPEHLRFAVLAVDVAMFTLRDGSLLVRCVRVERPPQFPGNPGLPGGLLLQEETAEQTAVRMASKKGGIASPALYMEQLATFSRIDRDPRNRVVAVAYLGVVPWEQLTPAERADSPFAWWADAASVKRLAFDHQEILAAALKRLRSRVGYTTLIGKLMPPEFTLTDLERAYAAVLGKPLDKRNFRKKMAKLKILKKTGGTRQGIKARPAALYAFARKSVVEIPEL